MRQSHGQYFMNQGRYMGVEARVDPKVQQLNKRDMELTVHKRRRVQQQRQAEKNKSKDKFDKLFEPNFVGIICHWFKQEFIFNQVMRIRMRRLLVFFLVFGISSIPSFSNPGNCTNWTTIPRLAIGHFNGLIYTANLSLKNLFLQLLTHTDISMSSGDMTNTSWPLNSILVASFQILQKSIGSAPLIATS